MVFLTGPVSRAIARRQSYIEISNYLRGLYYGRRSHLRCQQHQLNRRFHAGSRLRISDTSLSSSHPFLEEYKSSSRDTAITVVLPADGGAV